MNTKSYPFMGCLATSAKDLPVPPPAVFLGREKLLETLNRQLDAHARVLLHGPEGIGKTAAAAALAAQRIRQHPGAVVWINAGADDLGELADQVGRAYAEAGVLNAPDSETQLARARSLLAERKPLLVLDHIEDAQAASQFIEMVAPDLPAVALAREPLPGPWEPVAVEALSRQAATTLFYNQAGLVPGDDADDVDRLCALLEDHPLAIEIAAWLMMIENLGPGELLALLPAAAVEAQDPTQGVLRVAFERLPPGEQAVVLVVGATFAGGGTPEVLGAVADLGADYIQRAIGRLETRRFGRVISVDGRAYWAAHHAVYRFAHALLSQMGRLEAAEARAGKALAAYAARHKDNDDALHAEWGNLLGALAWAVRLGDAATAGAIGEAMAHSGLLTIHGHARLQEQLAQVSAAAAPAPLAEAPVAPPPAPPPAEVAEGDWPGRALTETGDAHLAAGDLEAAEAAYAQAVQRAREAGNLLMEGRLLERLGRVNEGLARDERAAESYRLAAIAAHRAGDLATEGAAMASMGAAFARLGRADHAIATYQRAIPLLREAGQGARLARTAHDLALALADQGRLEEAREMYQSAAEAARAAGDGAVERDALLGLGEVHRLRQQHELAIGAHRQALDLSRALGDRQGEELALGAMGVASLGLGDAASAASYLAQALTLSDELGEEGHERDWIGSLAKAYEELGEDERAMSAYRRAVDLAHKAGDQRSEAGYLNSLGLLLSRRGQPAEAIDYFQRALTIARVTQARTDQAGFLNNIGLAYMDLRELETAIVHFQQALEISRDLGDRQGEATALGNIGVGFGRMARWPAALQHHTQALEIARALDNRYDQSRQLGNIGLAHEALGRREPALQAYKEALDIAYQIDDRGGQAALLYLLGGLLMDDMASLAEAVSMLEESLAIRQEQGHPLIDETRRRLGRAQKRLERAQRAGLPVLPAATAEERRALTRDAARRGAVRRAVASAVSAAEGEVSAPPAPPPDVPPDLPEEPIPEPPDDLPA